MDEPKHLRVAMLVVASIDRFADADAKVVGGAPLDAGADDASAAMLLDGELRTCRCKTRGLLCT